MRALVLRAASAPTGGRWQVVLIEDADRLTEGAGNALLKAVEEPPPRTVFLLCAPSDHPDDISVTIRSRCRVVTLRSRPPRRSPRCWSRRDGIDAATGRVGRGRRAGPRRPGPAAGPRPGGPRAGARRCSPCRAG